VVPGASTGAVVVQDMDAVGGENGDVRRPGEKNHLASVLEEGRGYRWRLNNSTIAQAHHRAGPSAHQHSVCGAFAYRKTSAYAAQFFKERRNLFLHLKHHLEIFSTSAPDLGSSFPVTNLWPSFCTFLSTQIVRDIPLLTTTIWPVHSLMRVSILRSWPAVSGPARIADAVGTFLGCLGDHVFEIASLPGARRISSLAVLRHNRDAPES